MKLIAALAAPVLLIGCMGSQAPSATLTPSAAGFPTDGVHIDGAIQVVYPIADGAPCNIASLTVNGTTTRILQMSGKAQDGALLGMQIVGYKGPGVYTKIDWQSFGASGLWVGILPQGRTWHAHSGQITVTSDVGGKISGTLAATNLLEVGGATKVNARGAWTCSVQPAAP
ncbi:MAG TPA: hypothetical protein VKD46_07530 [bacterium]|nr:hypothetical protein [bacterium]